MGIVLSSYTVNGVKNIKLPVTMNFMNYANDSKDGARYSDVTSFKSVSSVYGPNGAGKSALVHGVEILLPLIQRRGYLGENNTQKYLSALMNRATNTMELSVEYFVIEAESKKKSKPFKYKYSITLKKHHELGAIDIWKEELYELKPHKKTILLVEKSEIKEGVIDSKIKEKVRGKLLNRTFFDVIFYDIAMNETENESIKKMVMPYLMPVAEFVVNTEYYLEKSDVHTKYKIDDIWGQIMHLTKTTETNSQIEYEDEQMIIRGNDAYKVFKKDLIKATKFLQMFKTDLMGIESKDRVEGELHRLTFEFVYEGNYRIDKELESTGIKKMFNLFFIFNKFLKRGKVLFLDEFDCSINDIYLLKLIEYFADYSRGQIIFTTHNASPMEVMNNKYRRQKCQICFLNQENTIATWKQIGSFNPSNLYKKGQINGLPFSVDATDFITLFKE